MFYLFCILYISDTNEVSQQYKQILRVAGKYTQYQYTFADFE